MSPDRDRWELGLLGLIALSVSALAGWAIARGSAGESAAWSAILMAIVNAIKERWSSRTIDRMSDRQAGLPDTPNAEAASRGDTGHRGHG